MQCEELMCYKVSKMTQGTNSVDNKPKKSEKETIHSGHFMVSDFELEAQDDEDLVGVPVPEEEGRVSSENPVESVDIIAKLNTKERATQQLSIDSSLSKLFQCMSLAYRQKLTSPKWNRFKGIRLRWKEKIRLNNVIWRCWHMQFIRRENTLVCQFASPLDVNMHDKPEAVVLEGKYWKRKLAAVTAEYKKWRMFYRNRMMGVSSKDGSDMLTDTFDWQPHSNDSVHSVGSMMVDEDYMEFMSDTLFSTITSNQPFAFPDPREISRGASIADFIQPSLVQLQPNLDDFMDTLEPLQDLLCTKLPSVPEECVTDELFRVTCPEELDLLGLHQHQTPPPPPPPPPLPPQSAQAQTQVATVTPLQYTGTIFAQPKVEGTFPQTTPGVSFQQAQSIGVGKVRMHRPSRSHPVHPSLQQKPASTASLPQSRSIFSQQLQQLQQQQQQPPPPPPPPPQPSSPQQPIAMEMGPPPSQYQTFTLAELATGTPPSNSPPLQQSYILAAQTSNLQQQAFQQRVVRPSQQYPAYRMPSTIVASDGQATKVPSLRSNSLPGPQDDNFVMPKYNQLKQRNRSRSGSSLATPTASQGQGASSSRTPQTLASHASDPALASQSSSSNFQPLLAQLLTTNSLGIYNFTGTSEKGRTQSVVPILPALGPNQSKQTTVLITTSTPVNVSPSIAHVSNQLLLSSLSGTQPGVKGSDSPSDSSAVASPAGLNLSPLSSPHNVVSASSPGPLSPSKSTKGDIDNQSASSCKVNTPEKADRRRCHINAEQKRRYNIKNGFDTLHSLIPQLHQNPNAKLSKAAMLQKGADYIRQLRAERLQLREEMEGLRQQIDCLNQAINNCQSLLPATGAPVSRQRASKMREMFDEYVRVRTMENWKFWIFSILLEPLLTSFNATVSTASLEDLYRSTLLWVEQKCSLTELRPAVLMSLRHLSTNTDILSDPSRLPEEARQAVLKRQQHHSGIQ